MKVVVSVKTATGGAVNAEDAFRREGQAGPSVLSQWDAHAVEEALRIVEKKAGGGEVVAIAVARAEALGALREALALGAHRALMLSDPALDGSDLLAVSRALAALLGSERADLYLTCSWSGDSDGTMLWVAAAERLKLPVLTQARSLSLGDQEATIQRQVESGDLMIAASLPCMVEVTETINKPRYPTIKGRLAARNKPVGIVRLADLGVAPESVGSAGRGTTVLGLERPPVRREPAVIADPERAPEQIVAFLEARHLI